MSEEEIVGIIKQTLEEHSKSLVSKSDCSGKLWGIGKWILPVFISICGAFTGVLLTVKVDISRIDNQQKTNTTNISDLQTTVKANWNVINYKLDKLLGTNPKLSDYTNEHRN